MSTDNATTVITTQHKPYTVVGLSGFKRSGKDTVGEYLCKNYGFTRVGFADALKEACGCVFSFSDEQLYGDKEKEAVDDYWGHSPREILQIVGSELFRVRLPELCPNISPDIWVKSVERRMDYLHSTDPNKYNKFVVTDVRFHNEADFVHNCGGRVYRVNRFEMDTSNLHMSEKFIPELNVNGEIENKSTLDELFFKVEEMKLWE